MQLCPALPFIVESIIITVSRWGLGDVYYEFFIFSIITEKNKIKRCRCILFPRIFFSRGGHGRGIVFPASSQAGDLECPCCKIHSLRSSWSHAELRRPRRGGQPPPLPSVCWTGAVPSHPICAWCVERVGAEVDRARGLSVLLLWPAALPGMGQTRGSYQGPRVGVRIGLCLVINITINIY